MYSQGNINKTIVNIIKIFESLLLEIFQAGLSWITILRKRENFRNTFDNFNIRLRTEYY